MSEKKSSQAYDRKRSFRRKMERVRSPETFLAARRLRMPHTSVSMLEKTNFLQKHPTVKSRPERKCPLRSPEMMCTFSTKKQKKLLKNNHNCSAGLRTCCVDRKETYEGTESLRITKISGRPVPDGKSGLPFSIFFSKKYKKNLFFFVILH